MKVYKTYIYYHFWVQKSSFYGLYSALADFYFQDIFTIYPIKSRSRFFKLGTGEWLSRYYIFGMRLIFIIAYSQQSLFLVAIIAYILPTSMRTTKTTYQHTFHIEAYNPSLLIHYRYFKFINNVFLQTYYFYLDRCFIAI